MQTLFEKTLHPLLTDISSIPQGGCTFGLTEVLELLPHD
jgi:hypothetical protein